MTESFAVVEREDEVPICPHCHLDLDEVHMRRRGAPLIQGRTIVFFCPHCKSVLGFGQERVA